MIAGALLDLGVSEQEVRRALDDAGLYVVGLRVTRHKRKGAAGVLVELTDDAGRPLVPEGEPRTMRRSSLRTATRRRHQAPHVDVRAAPDKKAMGVAQGDPEEGDEDGQPPSEEAGRVLSLGGEVVPTPPDAEPPRPKGAVKEWLSGKEASAEALLSHLVGQDLAPVTKAIAVKALRRTLTTRASLEGEVLSAVTLPGAEAVELMAEAVTCAALLGALSPARVSATAVLLDQEPDPWVEAVLEGTRVHEADVGYAPTTPLGAALVWAVAHRFGPRGDVVLGRAGTGLGRTEGRGRAHVSRALYGADKEVTTRAGAGQHAEVLRLEGVLDSFERRPLLEALVAAGAYGITTEAVLDEDGAVKTRLVCALPKEASDEVSLVLFGSGAASEVMLSSVERRRPERREVTVTVGRGNRKELVRLTEVRAQGRLLTVEPSRQDLREASSRLRLPLEALREEALDAHGRLERHEPEDR